VKISRLNLFVVVVCVCGTIGIAAWLWWSACTNHAIPYLPRRSPAQWIVYPLPFSPAERHRVELETTFRQEFLVSEASSQAELSLCAFTRCSLALNGVPVSLPLVSQGNWKKPLTVEVSKLLKPGQNKIEITVYNESGPPALWLALRGKGLAIFSDAAWEASCAGAVWRHARLAREPAGILKGSAIDGGERLSSSLAAQWPALVWFAFISASLLAGGCWWFKRAKGSKQTYGSGMFADPAAACLVGIILLWVLLFLHNADVMPRIIGFDTQGHLDYINYIQERGSLPLADEGITMYNPPLYYLMAATVLGACGLRTADFAGVVVLRYLALLIGIAQLLLVGRALRLVFPRQSGRQVIGLLLAGLLPAQLYLSHYITNEVLSGVLVTATLYACLRALQDEVPSPKRFATVGALMGLALLTKFTTVLVVPFVVGAIALRLFQTAPRDVRLWLRTTGVTVLTFVVVCGWHYARVWVHFGRPFVGNWEPGSGQFGWQDPGYRTGSYFLGFGESLGHPLFSGQASFADAIYSTWWGDGYCGGVSGLMLRSPWNYELMTVGYLLALLPTLLIGVGALISLGRFIRNPTGEGLLLNGLAWAFVAALFHMALKFPTYALIKAFYGLLIILPVCAFGALGWDFFARRRTILWLALSVAVGIWALGSFGSYWVARNSMQTHLLLGVDMAVDGKNEKAVQQLSAALAAAPTNTLAKSLLADALNQLGQGTAAERLHKELCQEHPDSAACQMEQALGLEKQGRLAEAAEHTRLAVNAAPDDLQTRQQLASRLMKLERAGEAVAACRDGLGIAPADSELHLLLGMALLQQAGAPAPLSEPGTQAEAATNSMQTEEAFRHLRLACQISSNSFRALEKLAWVLATSADARWRNGMEAVQLAERACGLTNYRWPEAVGTLAVSYAEAGRFPDAIRVAQQAQSLARARGQTQLVELYEEWITLFRAGRAYRQPRAPSGTKPDVKNAITP